MIICYQKILVISDRPSVILFHEIISNLRSLSAARTDLQVNDANLKI